MWTVEQAVSAKERDFELRCGLSFALLGPSYLPVGVLYLSGKIAHSTALFVCLEEGRLRSLAMWLLVAAQSTRGNGRLIWMKGFIIS